MRKDHTDLMGETEKKIASVLSLDITRHCTVFMPEGGLADAFRPEARQCKAQVITVAGNTSLAFLAGAPDLRRLEFAENLDLACAIATHLGISRERISEGIRKAHYDIGGLAMWRHPDRDYFFVNAFAANDPESTFRVLDRVSAALPAMSGSVVGVMNLRADRMPRTLQWLDVFQKGTHRFRQLVVVGEFTRAVERRLPHAQFLRIRKPETIMQSVYIQAPEPAIIFGFGNVKGMGRTLIGHWSTIGMPYAPAGTTG